MAKQSPLQAMKEKFGEKTKLVSTIRDLVGDDLWVGTAGAKSLEHVSNAKLLRMHATFSDVKTKFGTRAKLVDALLDLDKRAKDEGYRSRLGGYPVARLYDMWKSTSKRSAAAKAKSAAAPAAAGKATDAKATKAAATSDTKAAKPAGAKAEPAAANAPEQAANKAAKKALSGRRPSAPATCPALAASKRLVAPTPHAAPSRRGAIFLRTGVSKTRARVRESLVQARWHSRLRAGTPGRNDEELTSHV